MLLFIVVMKYIYFLKNKIYNLQRLCMTFFGFCVHIYYDFYNVFISIITITAFFVQSFFESSVII